MNSFPAVEVVVIVSEESVHEATNFLDRWRKLTKF